MAAGADLQFGKYQILEKLAEGRFSSIYKARLEGIGGFHRLFAIKRLPPSLSENQAYVDRLIEEAKLAGLLSHANIVQILDLGRIDESYYIAMEFVNGRDLGTVLKRCRSKNITLPLPHALFIIIESLKGLDYAHQRKVLRGGRPVPLNLVHRGLSPSNILASLQGEVKLTDFGLTRAHQAIGKPSLLRLSYQSPEQISEKAVDNRSDIFSLGVVLYEMLSGVHPFLRRTEEQTQKAILEHKLKPLSAVNPDVPYSLEVILEQALATNAEERFQTAAAFKESVEGFFHDAGFIFSHSTLAAFLKGLFPKKAIKKAPRAYPDQETIPLSSEFPLIDDESEEIPTSLNSVDLIDSPTDSAEYPIHPLHTAIPIDTSVSSTSASFGPSGNSGDDSTLILRPNPAREPVSDWQEKTRVDNTDDNTLARAKLSDEKTNVRAVPQDDTAAFKKPESSSSNQAKIERTQPPNFPEVQIPLNAQQTETLPLPIVDYEESLSGPLPKPPRKKATEDEYEEEQPSILKSTSHLALLMAGILVLGLFVGFVMGQQGGEDGPTTSVDPSSATTRQPPVLQIMGPEGAEIKVDDRSYSIDKGGMAEMTLEPDQPTTIRIQAEGFQPAEYSYTPRENGIRKLTLEWDSLRPTP